MKRWMNRAAIHVIFLFWFIVLSSFQSSLFRADLSRCDFVTFQYFLPSSFQPGAKQGGSFKCNCKAVITRLSFSFSLLSPLWPALTFKSVFSYSSQSILSIEKAPAKPDLWTNKRCGGKGERWETHWRQMIWKTPNLFSASAGSSFCAKNSCHIYKKLQ